MPAALTEAFQSPGFDASSYTRSSLDSLKNPNFGFSHNSHMDYYHQTGGFLAAQQRQPCSIAQLPNNFGNISSNSSDSLSLISSISSNQFSNEVERIKQTYSDNGSLLEGFEEKDCDTHIHHILSCSECRKRLKKLLDDNASDEFQDPINKSNTTTSTKEQIGGLNLDFNYLLNNDNLQNILVYIISGILLILVLDFFKRFGIR